MNELTCEKCGSDRIIPDVHILDQGQYSSGKLNVRINTNPKALFFKEPIDGQLKAQVCGGCGHTELKVDNPRALYKAYRELKENST